MSELKKDESRIERRVIRSKVTVEKREDGEIKSIVGYPIVYNKWSENLGGFIERILPGAATKALKGSDIRGLKNHESSLIFAREGVNLTLKEDKDGVSYIATPVDTHNYIETAKEVELGLLDGQSFGFRVTGERWTDTDKQVAKRDITELEIIYDVGPVTYPAYSDTSVALRSLYNIKKDGATAAEDAATGALAKKRNLDIDILIAERSEGGLKR